MSAPHGSAQREPHPSSCASGVHPFPPSLSTVHPVLVLPWDPHSVPISRNTKTFPVSLTAAHGGNPIVLQRKPKARKVPFPVSESEDPGGEIFVLDVSFSFFFHVVLLS